LAFQRKKGKATLKRLYVKDKIGTIRTQKELFPDLEERDLKKKPSSHWRKNTYRRSLGKMDFIKKKTLKKIHNNKAHAL